MMSPTIEYVEPSTADRDFGDPEQIRSYFDAQNIAIAETIHELMQYANNPDFILIDGQTLGEYLASGQACPIGMVAAFYLTWNDALNMRGWRICDGRDGTPQIHPNPDYAIDETNIARFIRASGWGEDVTDGCDKRRAGSSNHRHKIEIADHTHLFASAVASLASHTHSLAAASATISITGSCTTGIGPDGSHCHTCAVAASGTHNHTGTANTTTHMHSISYCSCTDYIANVSAGSGISVNLATHTHAIDGGGHAHTVSIPCSGSHTHTVDMTAGDHYHTVPVSFTCSSTHTHTISGTISAHADHLHIGVTNDGGSCTTYTQGPVAPASGSDTTCANYPPYREVIFMLRVKE